MSETLNEYDDLLDGTEHRWRNRLIGLAVLAALVAAGGYALWAMVLGGEGSTEEEIQTAEVQRGSISVTVSTTGVVAAQSTTNLSFEESGRVSAVNVTLGQEVKQGDVLAEIESDALQDALVKAEANLASAQIKLDQLLEGADAAELISADQSVVQAQASYDQAYRAMQDLLEGPSESERLSAEQSVSSAQSQLAKAEEAREKLYEASEDAIDATEEAVRRAEDALEDAEDAADDAADSVDSAEMSLKSAETAYCLSPDYLSYPDAAVSFCAQRAAPISSADEAVLMEITVTGSPDLAKEAASVLSANTSYEKALDAEERAEDAVDSAEEDLAAAEEDLEDAKSGPSSEEIASADAAVVSAQQGLDVAKAKLAELYEEPTEDELAQAQDNLDTAAASLAAAQAKRDDVYDGTDWQDIELQRDQVELAQISVKRAREDLDKAQLIAPFDGTVAALNTEVGEVAGAGGEAAIVLNTPDAVRMDLTISEADMPSIQVGQGGIAFLDAIEDIPFPIVIESIGTNPTTTQGVVIYEVRASILTGPPVGAAGATSPTGGGELPGDARGGSASPPATPVPGATPSDGARELPSGTGELPAAVDTEAKPLPGMNASVTIIVDQAQDVLTIPAQAVQSEGRDSIVEVLKEDGTTERVVVETGLSDGTNTEIISGLEEGQTIIIPTGTAAAAEATPSAGFPGGGFPGGGFPGGGGFPDGGGGR